MSDSIRKMIAVGVCVEAREEEEEKEEIKDVEVAADAEEEKTEETTDESSRSFEQSKANCDVKRAARLSRMTDGKRGGKEEEEGLERISSSSAAAHSDRGQVEIGAFYVEGLSQRQHDDSPNDSLNAGTTHSTRTNSNLIEAELVIEEEERSSAPVRRSSRIFPLSSQDSRNPIAVAVAASDVKKKWICMGLAVVLIVALLVVLLVVVVTNNSGGGGGIAVDPENVVNTEYDSFTDSLQLGNKIIGSAPRDSFGESFALSQDGTILAIGARNNGDLGFDTGFDTGLARVFTLTNSTTGNDRVWLQLGNTMGGEQEGDKFAFSGMAISADGSRIAVGSPYYNVTLDNSTMLGHAGNLWVFDLTRQPTPTWRPVGDTIGGLGEEHWFGRSVAVSADGKILAASASQSSENGTFSGHVRIFRQSNVNPEASFWEQMGNTLYGHWSMDKFGRSIAMSADGMTIAIGASQFPGEGPGYVEVFQFDAAVERWNRLGRPIFGDKPSDLMGREVALNADGTVLACGANFNDKNGDEAGMARVYKLVDDDSPRTISDWRQIGEFLGSNAGDRLGEALAFSADGFRLAVGATAKSNGNGYVRIFDYNTELFRWEQVGQDLEGAGPADRFGADVKMTANGKIVAVSAPSSDANGEDSGYVQVFNLNGM